MKEHLSALSLLLLLAALLTLGACSSDDDGTAEPVRPEETIIQVINDTEGLDSLQSYLQLFGSDFTNQLANNEHTVFAPNNAAFADLLNDIGLRSMFELRQSLLSEILLYHIVANTAVPSNQLDSTLTTLSGSIITLSTDGDSIIVNPATQPNRTEVVAADLNGANGVVHVVNEVLLPPALATDVAPLFGSLAGLTTTLSIPLQQPDGSPADGGLDVIASVFNAAGLGGALTGTVSNTVLAPLNESFNSFFLTPSVSIEELANYHIIPGEADPLSAGRTIATLGGEVLYVTNLDGALFLNGVRFFDLGYTPNNGRILFSTEVLKPAIPLGEAISVAEATSGESFTIFNTALEQTGLELGTDQTIFVPTDSAFIRAGLTASIDSAARIDPNLLANVLQTHVFAGINFSTDIIAAEPLTVTALNGTELTIAIAGEEGRQFVSVQDGAEGSEDAAVVLFDNLSDNGVVHVIDRLLLPQP